MRECWINFYGPAGKLKEPIRPGLEHPTRPEAQIASDLVNRHSQSSRRCLYRVHVRLKETP